MLEELGIKSFDILNRTSASIKYKFPTELQSIYIQSVILLPTPPVQSFTKDRNKFGIWLSRAFA